MCTQVNTCARTTRTARSAHSKPARKRVQPGNNAYSHRMNTSAHVHTHTHTHTPEFKLLRVRNNSSVNTSRFDRTCAQNALMNSNSTSASMKVSDK